MICRLCLKDLSNENPILLFNDIDEDAGDNVSGTEKEQEEDNGQQLVKMIANYLYLELSEDDTISTFICNDCCTNLKNFHNFWEIIEKKQRTLNGISGSTMWNCDVNWPDDEDVNDNKEGNHCLETKKASHENQIAANEILRPKRKCDVHTKLIDANNREDDGGSDDVDMPLELTIPKAVDTTLAPNESKNMDQKRPSKLEIHKENEEIVANFMRLKCPICMDNTNTYRTYSDLRDHFNMEHKRPPYVKCCDVIFSRLSRLVEHVHWHLNPSEFTCTFCLKTMRSKKSLQNHLKCSHNSELDIASPSLYSITGNELSHNQRIDLITKNSTQAKLAAAGNSDIVGDNSPENNSAIMERTPLNTCETCGQYFNCSDTLQRHLLEHLTIFTPRLQCTTFETPSFSCEQRLNELFNTTNLEDVSNNMNDPIKKDKKFQCQYCEKSFKLRRYLDEHIATHTGAKLHTCPHCTTEFRCKSNMYAHIKRKHQKEWIEAHESKKLNNQKQNCAPLTIVPPTSREININNNNINHNNNNNNNDNNSVINKIEENGADKINRNFESVSAGGRN